MIRVAISVEGQTEDEFCKQVLAPYFRNYNESSQIKDSLKHLKPPV